MKIERKFLIDELPNLDGCIYSNINSGYISFIPYIRIRKNDDKYFIMKKEYLAPQEDELETETNKDTFNILASVVNGRMISKTRYFLPFEDGNIVKLDIYHDELEGLATAKVAFKNKADAQEYNRPGWFGEEITNDKNYDDSYLSTVEDIPFAKKEGFKKVYTKK